MAPEAVVLGFLKKLKKKIEQKVCLLK